MSPAAISNLQRTERLSPTRQSAKAILDLGTPFFTSSCASKSVACATIRKSQPSFGGLLSAEQNSNRHIVPQQNPGAVAGLAGWDGCRSEATKLGRRACKARVGFC